MKLAITSIPVPAPGATLELDAQIAEMFRGRSVAIAHSHVFSDAQGRAHLVLLLDGSATAPRADPGAKLDPEARARYHALRLWRNRRALETGSAPYLVVSNRALAGIARRQPADAAELLDVKGLGPKKIAQWGDEILAEVAALAVAPPPTEIA